LYTYHKLIHILEQNRNVKTVFCEFTNNEIPQDIDKWIWNDVNIEYRYVNYFPFLSLKEHIIIILHNPIYVTKKIGLILRKGFTRVLKKKYSYANIYGGYNNTDKCEIDSLDKVNSIIKHTDVDTTLKISEYSIEYLNKIIELCKNKNVSFFLIRSPIHPNDKSYQYEKEMIAILNKFDKVNKLDFSKYPLSNGDYMDYEHLNKFGAYKISNFLNKLIISGELNHLK